MRSLLNLQLEFQQSVQTGRPLKRAEDILRDTDGQDRTYRLGIYQTAYLTRMTESLKDDFATLGQRLGEDQLSSLVEEFVRRTPSVHQNLAEYSESFPRFLKEHHSELYSVARKEWMSIVTRQGAVPERVLTLSEVQAGQAFRLVSHPSVFISDVGAEDMPMVSFLKNNHVEFLGLSSDQVDFLRFLTRPRSSVEVEAWIEARNSDGRDFGKDLQSWIQEGLVYCQGVDL